jgi:hypothetical protein
LINDIGQSAIKSFDLRETPNARFGQTKGGTVKTISSIAADQSFKAMSVVSCVGLAVSVCMMALGMDPSAVWL